jgi:hypothetical protein
MAAGIVWLSLTPSPPAVDFKASDKLGHLAGYGLLMFWFCRLYLGARARLLYGIGFVAMGIGLEFAQGALGFRTYELLDMSANTAGVLLGWAASRMLPRPA